MVTLYLMRHGETVDNALQLMQGQIQGELNDVGKRQAELVRDEMAHLHLDAVVASDLKRSVDTARIVAEPHGLSVVTSHLLRERDWGDFTGRYIPDLKGLPWPDNVEKLDHLLYRAGLFLEFLRREYEGKTVLAVGHGIINKAIQAVYHDCDMKDVSRMTNAEVRMLRLIHSYSRTHEKTTNDNKFCIV